MDARNAPETIAPPIQDGASGHGRWGFGAAMERGERDNSESGNSNASECSRLQFPLSLSGDEDEPEETVLIRDSPRLPRPWNEASQVSKAVGENALVWRGR